VRKGRLSPGKTQVQEDAGSDEHAKGPDQQEVLDRVGVVLWEGDGSASGSRGSRGIGWGSRISGWGSVLGRRRVVLQDLEQGPDLERPITTANFSS